MLLLSLRVPRSYTYHALFRGGSILLCVLDYAMRKGRI
jgi:hypothetical protein